MAKNTLVDLKDSERGKDTTAKKVGDIDPREKISVTIGLSGPKLPGPDEFAGRIMSPKELKEKFGAKEADADKVKEVLEKKYKLKVKKVSLLTRTMQVNGTAENLKKAFDPQWEMKRSPTQGLYRGRAGKLKIPKELEGIVTGVFGLDERQMAFPKSGVALTTGKKVLSEPWTPKVIANHYNFPLGEGAGQTIAIAQFGGGYFREDLTKYFKDVVHKRPPRAPNIKLIRVGSKAGAKVLTLKDILGIPDPELRLKKMLMTFEVMMDVELIAGLCPKANILVFFAKNTQKGWCDLLTKVIHTRPTPVVLSISWGYAEDDRRWSKGEIFKIDALLNQVSRKGITTCVASGDDGWRNQITDGRYHVDFPSSSPYVLAVGGTMLEKSTLEEVAWREDSKKDPDDPHGQRLPGSASGGGVCRKFNRPVWQETGHIDPNHYSRGKKRVVPDVSALAGWPYYQLVFLQQSWPQGKTSASAPVWAALIARIKAKLPPDKKLPFLTPMLYKKMKNGKQVGNAAFVDIKKGNNAVSGPGKYYCEPYKACWGFDAVTGWGVPHGQELLRCLKELL